MKDNRNNRYEDDRFTVLDDGMSSACNEKPSIKKSCYTVEDLQIILGCGRESVYALLSKREFPWRRIGSGSRGAYRIPCKTFDQWLESGD